MMRKGYYYFGECGSIDKILFAIGTITAVISVFFLIMGGYKPLTSDEYRFTAYNAWFKD